MTLQALKDNLNNFSISQMLSNNDGKTSASSTIGCIVSLVGCLGFLIGVIDFALDSTKSDIMMYSGGIITLGTGLLGVNKLSKGPSVADEMVKVNELNK